MQSGQLANRPRALLVSGVEIRSTLTSTGRHGLTSRHCSISEACLDRPLALPDRPEDGARRWPKVPLLLLLLPLRLGAGGRGDTRAAAILLSCGS